MCRCVRTEVRGQPLASFLRNPQSFVLFKVVLWPGLHPSGKIASQRVTAIYLSPPLQPWDHRGTLASASFLCGCWGPNSGHHAIYNRHVSNGAISRHKSIVCTTATEWMPRSTHVKRTGQPTLELPETQVWERQTSVCWLMTQFLHLQYGGAKNTPCRVLPYVK